jgi:ADP-ribosylglycohydrolase
MAGCYPGDKDESTALEKLSRLLDVGIRTFVNLMEPDETSRGTPFAPYHPVVADLAAERCLTVECLRFPIQDVNVPSEGQMAEILRAIDESLAEERPVYIHCWGGRGRTGTVVGCYLITHGLATPANYVEIIREMRRNDASGGCSPETHQQVEFVRQFNAKRAEILDRYLGCLLGLAVGDAVGTSVEFKPPGTFEPVTDMFGGGPFKLLPGQWTDDTSMALCLAESLIECRGFDPIDQLQRYVRWWRKGYLSSTGECFDIGNTVNAALHRFQATGESYCGSTDPHSAGNGSIMRLAPVPMAYAQDPAEAIAKAGDSSRTTHGAQTAVDACRFMAGLVVGALSGADKETLLSNRYCPIDGYWVDHPLMPEVDAIAAGSFKTRNPPEIIGSGYVVASLEAALWAFNHSDSFEEGCLMAVNLGNDADTTAAVYGQIAGAYYGESGIPQPWLDKLAMAAQIREFATGLHKLCRRS